MSTLHLDSRSVPLGQRSRFWREAVQRVLHVDSETVSVGDQPLATALEKHEVGDLSVVAIRGSSQRVLVRDWARANTMHVLLPQTPGGFVEIDGARQVLQPGSSYVVNARGPLLIQAPDGFEHIALFLPLSSSEMTRSLIARLEHGSLPLSGGVATTLTSTLLTLFANASAITLAAAPMVARATVELLNAALVETFGVPKHSAQHLAAHHRQRIRQHALDALGDPGLSVESIATAVGLSVRRIHQLFANGDMSLMRWIWSERLARCHSQLVDASNPRARISDLAYEWGFSDPAHFSRAFRQRYGMSPSQVLRPRQTAG